MHANVNGGTTAARVSYPKEFCPNRSETLSPQEPPRSPPPPLRPCRKLALRPQGLKGPLPNGPGYDAPGPTWGALSHVLRPQEPKSTTGKALVQVTLQTFRDSSRPSDYTVS